jgi:hypothetical protein
MRATVSGEEQARHEAVAQRVRESGSGVAEVVAQAPLGPGAELPGVRRDARCRHHRGREDERGGVDGEGRPRADEPDEPARDGRAHDLDEPSGRPGYGLGGEPLLLGREDRDDRLHRRAEERVGGRHAGRDQVGVPRPLRPQERQDERRPHQVGADQHRLAAEPVSSIRAEPKSSVVRRSVSAGASSI